MKFTPFVSLLLPLAIGATAAQASGPLRRAPEKKTETRTAVPGSAASVRAWLAAAPSAAQYPNAAKATLLDVAEITVRADGSARTRTHMLIKVFNERGRDEAEVRIPYNSSLEKVTITRARTIRPDGRVVTVAAGQIRDQAISAGDTTYTDARIKSFSLPAVDDGCLLDYEYITEQTQSPLKGHFWTRWWFQSGPDPVIESRLTVTVPKSLNLRQSLENAEVRPVVKEAGDGKTLTYVWAARDVAPIEPEPMMPSVTAIAPRLSLSTVDSWQEVAGWYWALAKDRMVADDTVKKQVAEITRGLSTPEEKARAIFYWVEEKTRYVGLELGVGAYQPRPATEVCRTQYGDCKDMTTLLVAMLREVGITAHPVLLRADSSDRISDSLPSPAAFDHAICLAEVDGRKFWLDATAQACRWGDIPGADRGADALVIRNGVGMFETIPAGAPGDNRTEQNIKIKLAPDGSATGTVTITGSGDVDLTLRTALTYLRPDRLKSFVEQMAQTLGPNTRVTSYAVSDFRDKNKPITITFDVTIPAWANLSGDLLLFKARAEQSGGAGASPFLQDERRYTLSQPRAALGLSTVEIALPTGFAILSAPKQIEVKGDLGFLQRTVKTDGGTMTISSRAENHRASVAPERYPDVKKYYTDLLKATEETIVLKRTE